MTSSSYSLKILTLACVILTTALATPLQSSPQTISKAILSSVEEMPMNGIYSVEPDAALALMQSIDTSQGFLILPKKARPSFCSMATYVVFLRAIEKLQSNHSLSVSTSALKLLDVPQTVQSLYEDDGKNAWGRWNGNGPGTSRLFYHLNLGHNFTDSSKREPGDFLKMFFTPAVGSNERGHSVVYLDQRKNPKTGDPEIQYFSSNRPGGNGKVWISESQIVHAIYSRLDSPQNLENLSNLPEWDRYLQAIRTTPSTWKEALASIGLHY